MKLKHLTKNLVFIVLILMISAISYTYELKINIVNKEEIEKTNSNIIIIKGNIISTNKIAKVLIKLNDSDWDMANSSDSFENFEAEIELKPGKNKIIIKAIDEFGNYISNDLESYYFRSGNDNIKFYDFKKEIFKDRLAVVSFRTTVECYIVFSLARFEGTTLIQDYRNKFVRNTSLKKYHSFIVSKIDYNKEYFLSVRAKNKNGKEAYFESSIVFNNPYLNRNLPDINNKAIKFKLAKIDNDIIVGMQEKYKISEDNDILANDVFIRKYIDNKWEKISSKIGNLGIVKDFDINIDSKDKSVWIPLITEKQNNIYLYTNKVNKYGFKVFLPDKFPPKKEILFENGEKKIININPKYKKIKNPKLVLLNNEVYLSYIAKEGNNENIIVIKNEDGEWIKLGNRVNLNDHLKYNENYFFTNFGDKIFIFWKNKNNIYANYWNGNSWIAINKIKLAGTKLRYSINVVDDRLFCIINNDSSIGLFEYKDSKWSNLHSLKVNQLDSFFLSDKAICIVNDKIIIAIADAKKITVFAFYENELKKIGTIKNLLDNEIKSYLIEKTNNYFNILWLEGNAVYHKSINYN